MTIGGPTASGKSALAMLLCERLNGELVSADSMQIYRGMDILTAKPTPDERARIPHHMIDVANPLEDYTVAMYRDGARAAIDDIIARGKTPVMCGGTGLYINAVTRPMSLGAHAQDKALRQRLMDMAQDGAGRAELHRRLKAVDAEAAARLHENDVRRVVRALEIYETIGITPSELARRDAQQEDLYDTRLFAIEWPREALCSRIDRRVDEMVDMGLFAEVAALMAQGVPDHATAMQALGYKEAVRALRDELSREEAVALIKLRTRQYAKRQMTWFRGDKRTVWIAAASLDVMIDDITKQTDV